MVPKLGTLNCVVQITFCCVLAGGAGNGVCVRGVGGGGCPVHHRILATS